MLTGMTSVKGSAATSRSKRSAEPYKVTRHLRTSTHWHNEPRRAAIVDHGSTGLRTDELVGLAGADAIRLRTGSTPMSSTTSLAESSLNELPAKVRTSVCKDIEACTSGAKALSEMHFIAAVNRCATKVDLAKC